MSTIQAVSTARQRSASRTQRSAASAMATLGLLLAAALAPNPIHGQEAVCDDHSHADYELLPTARTKGIPLTALQREIAVQARAEKTLFRLPGVVGVGITLQDEQPAILVLVNADGARAGIPTELEGVPVKVEVEADARLINGSNGSCGGDLCPNESIPPCHNDPQSLPVQMGNATSSAGTCDSGTLGFKACHLDSLTVGYVSANHVAAGVPNSLHTHCFNGPAGMAQMHPGNCENPLCTPSNVTFTNNIGSLHSRVQIFGSPAINYADAAFVTSSNSQSQWSIRDVGTPQTTWSTTGVGACVKKSGRKTGLTWGVVDAVNVNHSFGSSCFTGFLSFRESIRIRPATASECVGVAFDRFATGGDSGSALLDTSNRIVGLVFAEGFLTQTQHRTYANRIQRVVDKNVGGLGLSLDPTQCSTSVTLNPTADAFVAQEQPTTNFGFSSVLRIRSTTSGFGRYSFLKFSVPQHGGKIIGATLRLRVESSVQQAAFYRVNNMVWSENTVNWNNWNASNPTWTFLGNYSNLSPGVWYNFNVTGAALGTGEITFGIASQANIGQQDFYSRNSASDPQLILTYGPK